MNSFKIDIIKQQPPIPTLLPIKSLPKLTMNIQSIICLNYPIDILCQVITSHFDEQPCPANLVAKVLKIISISLKDNELKTNIQKILQNNIHKRQRAFILVQYWCSITNGISQILSKFDIKLLQNILGCVISEYCLTRTKNNPTLSQMISQSFNTLSQQSCSRIGQIVRNQYISSGCPFVEFIKSIKKMNLKNQKYYDFCKEITSSIMKIKQTQQYLSQIFINYFSDNQIRTTIDQYFTIFPNLITYFIQGIQTKLLKEQVLDIWINTKQYKMEQPIKSSIKEWSNKKPNYWQLFKLNYTSLTKQSKRKQLKYLLQLGLQLNQQNLLHNYIVKEHLYCYLEWNGKQQIPGKVGEILTTEKGEDRYIWSALDVISQMTKSMNNTVNDGIVHLMMMNKIHAPLNWVKADHRMLKTITAKSIQPFIQKLNNLYQKHDKKCKQKGQVLQLAFHGILIAFRNQPQNTTTQFTVTFHQLLSILKQNKLLNNINLNEQYSNSLTETNKLQSSKQIQTIVMEAKIVKVLKRSNKKLSFPQLYHQLEQLKISQQNCKIALKKTISKGIITQIDNGYYLYCP